MTKVCFVSSSGGHLKELFGLKKLSREYESFLITEKDEFNNIIFGDKQYYVRKIDRKERKFLFHFFVLLFKIFKILWKEKPDFIITTGALIGFPTCLLGKLFRAKIIYIESFARINNPSLTGKLVYRISDLFIVQWKDLLKFYPKAVYYGGIF